MAQHSYIYLHGFASSPGSTKAQYLSTCLGELKQDLHIPDLNQEDFTHLTLTRQLQQVSQLVDTLSGSVTLIGSSFGGLTAAWFGEIYPEKVQNLILLAPAFSFLEHLTAFIGKDSLKNWQDQGFFPFYHYGEERQVLLHYQFILDLQGYQETELRQPVPTLIFHGVNDTVIPINASQEYARSRDWVKLQKLESDHNLTDVFPEIAERIYSGIKSSKITNCT